jgi:ABC-type sugar transport system ATPase subunit
MRSELKDLHQRLGATMLYVTHDQSEAMSLSDRIVVMSAGRIEQVGSPRELYQQPANLVVARFLGEPGMNIFSGQIRTSRMQSVGFDLAIPPGLRATHDSISAGIRPENLVARDPDRAAFSGLVRTVEFLGSRSLLRADVGDTLVTAFLPADAGLSPGDRIGLEPCSPESVTWFDTVSGQALAPPFVAAAR